MLEGRANRGRDAVILTILTILTIAMLIWRRPDQFIHPYVWVEDGYYTLPATFSLGWKVIFNPLAGYLLFAARLIGYISYKAAILWAPQIQVALVVALTCGVVIAIAKSPTHLRWPSLCAAAVLFLPTNSEVYAVSAYANWWAGILIFLALLWDADRGRHWLRLFFIAFGGLSSPLAVTLLPLFALRAAVERRGTEMAALGVAILAAIAQLLAMRQQAMSGQFVVHFESISPELVIVGIKQLFGRFFVYPDSLTLVTGIGVGAALMLLAWMVRSRLDRYFVLLLLIYCVVCVSVAVRQPVAHLAGFDPLVAAPRYFFFPFIILSWLLIWLAASTPLWAVRGAIAASFVFTFLMSSNLIPRRHFIIDWPTQLLTCANQDGEYGLPIHWDGVEKSMEHRKTSGEECRGFMRGSLLH